MKIKKILDLYKGLPLYLHMLNWKVIIMIIEIILAIETVAFIVEGYVLWNLMKKVELLETYINAK